MQALQVLLFCGLDLKTGKWNTKQFPVTQTDAQMEGITSDIHTYNKSARDYNKYGEFLSKNIALRLLNSFAKVVLLYFVRVLVFAKFKNSCFWISTGCDDHIRLLLWVD